MEKLMEQIKTLLGQASADQLCMILRLLRELMK